MDLNTCLLHLIAVSVVSTHFIFNYRDTHASEGTCQTCISNNCIVIEPVRCKYYMKAMSVETRDLEVETIGEDQKMRTSVDEVLFDLIGNASVDYGCVPYISWYTDCTKENMCLGCQNCVCNEDGRWNCNTVQKCRASTVINVDHRVLVTVMEQLLEKKKNAGKTRTLRAVQIASSESNATKYDNISEWLYGVKPHNNETQGTEDKYMVLSTGTTIEITTEAKLITDSDSLAFEDVLNGIPIVFKNVTRRKPPLDMKHNETVFDLDFLIFDDEDNTTYNFNSTAISPSVFDLINDINHVTEKSEDATTNVIIDLLETAKHAIPHPPNATDFENYVDNDVNIPDTTYLDNNSVNIMKRETNSDLHSSIVGNSTSDALDRNSTKSKCKCNKSLLNPLFKLINATEREINELKAIKENLVAYYKSNIQKDIPAFHAEDNTSYLKLETESFKETYNIQKQNYNPVENYILKLKRDIYEVIRDIMLIRKHKGSAGLADDLKLLIHAMKHYINYHNVHKEFDAGMDPFLSDKQFKSFRRTDTTSTILQSLKDYIWKILTIIDKPMPMSNGLNALSNHSKKVILRVIEEYYMEDMLRNKFKINELSNNIANVLESVDKDMQLIIKLEKYGRTEELYAKKLIHFTISQYITKLEDVLDMTNASQSRRMDQEIVLTTDAVKKITTGLQAINVKVKLLLELHKGMTLKPIDKIRNPTAAREELNNNNLEHGPNQLTDHKGNKKGNVDDTKKKKSFMKKVLDLLSHSKKEIKDLLRKKVPKTEIIKQIAKNKLTELQRKKYSQYEESMKKWQNNLDVKAKTKREAISFNRYQGRIKNIIPKYLRGKVDKKLIQDKHEGGPTNKDVKLRKKKRE